MYGVRVTLSSLSSHSSDLLQRRSGLRLLRLHLQSTRTAMTKSTSFSFIRHPRRNRSLKNYLTLKWVGLSPFLGLVVNFTLLTEDRGSSISALAKDWRKWGGLSRIFWP